MKKEIKKSKNKFCKISFGVKNINIFISVFIAGLIIFVASAKAQIPTSSVNDSGVTYPIVELGGCKDKADCATYCSKSKNMLVCVNFAEKQGILKGEDLRISKVVANKVSKGETPGGCSDQASCESFCRGKVENINQCISFAEELNILPKDELDQAKNVAKALAGGAKLPGQCKDKESCENYCSDGSKIDECLSFAEAANILSPEDLKQAKAVAPFLKNGETPGKCQNKASCDKYCSDLSHADECIGFAEKAGFISKEEADLAKKVGGAGPGGCKSQAECTAYCNNESHADECANFALSKGLVDEKTAELMKNGVDQMNQALNSMPPELKDYVVSCLNKEIGTDRVQKILSKQATPTKDNGEKIQSCFAEIKDKAKEIMMKSAGGQIPGGEGGKAPSIEDLKSMIPSSVPAGMRDSIEKQIEAQSQSGGAGLSGGMPSSGGQVPQIDCSAFAQVPSCSYVPDGIARDTCEKCKGN